MEYIYDTNNIQSLQTALIQIYISVSELDIADVLNIMVAACHRYLYTVLGTTQEFILFTFFFCCQTYIYVHFPNSRIPHMIWI